VFQSANLRGKFAALYCFTQAWSLWFKGKDSLSRVDEIMDMVKILCENDIRYLLIKSYAELSLMSRNIDILIDEDRLKEVDHLLKNHGF